MLTENVTRWSYTLLMMPMDSFKLSTICAEAVRVIKLTLYLFIWRCRICLLSTLKICEMIGSIQSLSYRANHYTSISVEWVQSRTLLKNNKIRDSVCLLVLVSCRVQALVLYLWSPLSTTRPTNTINTKLVSAHTNYPGSFSPKFTLIMIRRHRNRLGIIGLEYEPIRSTFVIAQFFVFFFCAGMQIFL